jgi:hypothetical protein
MTTSDASNIDCEQVIPGFHVTDVLAAVDFYTRKLGFSLAFTLGEPPTFAGVNLGEASVHLIKGTPKPGATVYFILGDADALFALQRGNGVE